MEGARHDANDAGIIRLMAGLARHTYAWQAHPGLVHLIDTRIRLVAARKRHERPDRELFPKELITEGYLRIARDVGERDSRAHYFGAGAHAMRRIVIKRALHWASVQEADRPERVTFGDLEIACHESDTDILALHEALSTLEVENKLIAELVRLRYFGGLTGAEVIELLSLSPATVTRYWTSARARLTELMRQ